MQFLNTVAIVALATAVAADQSFTLSAQGNGLNSPVSLASNGHLELGTGSAVTFTLAEPSGWLSVDGKKIGVEGVLQTTDQDHASKDFGIINGDLRFGPSIDNTQFYACPISGNVYEISKSTCDGGSQVSLVINGAATPSSSASSSVPSSSAASSSAPSPVSSSSLITSSAVSSISQYANTTITSSHSTLSTITSCSNGCTQNATTSHSITTVNGAQKYNVGAGALLVAGLAML